jgi:hypothetical protein
MAESGTSCSQARTLERDAVNNPVLSSGPSQSGAWWSALSQKWQTANRGKQTSGPYHGTWEYGIWSSRKGVDTCPTVYFFRKHSLPTVGK